MALSVRQYIKHGEFSADKKAPLLACGALLDI
jgi:hypothetical protein